MSNWWIVKVFTALIAILLTGILVLPFGSARAATTYTDINWMTYFPWQANNVPETINTQAESDLVNKTIREFYSSGMNQNYDAYILVNKIISGTSSGQYYHMWLVRYPKGTYVKLPDYGNTSQGIRGYTTDSRTTEVAPYYIDVSNNPSSTATWKSAGYMAGYYNDANVQAQIISFNNQYYSMSLLKPTVQDLNSAWIMSTKDLNASVGSGTYFTVKANNLYGYQVVLSQSYESFWPGTTPLTSALVPPSGVIDLSDLMRINKAKFKEVSTDGLQFRVWVLGYSESGWKSTAEVDPDTYLAIDVRFTSDGLPTEDAGGTPGSGSGGSGGSGDTELPSIPTPPDSATDIAGWIRYLGDWILYIVESLGYFFSQLGTAIGTVFTGASGLTKTLTGVFSFLPPQITALLSMAILVGIVARLLKR